MNAENRYLLKLAIKNIRRNAGRSFFIGLSVTLSVSIAVWIMAFFDGMNHQIEVAVVRGNVGHYQLQEKNYSLTSDPLHPAVYTDAVKKAMSDPKIIAHSPELVLDGYLSAPEGTAALQVVGIDFKLHAQAMQLDRAIVAGHWPDQSERGIVIGKDIADKFLFKVGDQLVINFQDAKGELRSELLNILGIYRANGRVFERRFAYVSGDVVEEFLFGAADPRQLIHRILLFSFNLLDGKVAATDMARRTGLELVSWKDLNPEMAVVLDFHDGMIRFFFLIIGITILVTILTPVVMLWQERVSEIRMMTIIGVPGRKIWHLGWLEAMVMTFLSGTTASVVLTIIIGIQERTGLNFEALSKGQVMERAGIELPRVIYPLLLAHQLLFAYCFVVFIIFVSYSWGVHSVLKKARVQL